MWQKKDEETLRDKETKDNTAASRSDEGAVGEAEDILPDVLLVNDKDDVTLEQAVKMKQLNFYERKLLQNIKRKIEVARSAGVGDDESYASLVSTSYLQDLTNKVDLDGKERMSTTSVV